MQNYLASTPFALLPQWMEEDIRHLPGSMGKLLHLLTGLAIIRGVVEELGEVIS